MESILKDVSQYFELLKESGQKRVNVSEESKKIINEWWIACKGHENSNVYIIDSLAIFFSGESGKLLKKILKAMKLSEESVCICDIFCPQALINRINRKKPEVIITLGKKAADLFCENRTPLEYLRGRFHTFNGIKVMPTWHPLSLLDNPGKKRDVWEDMKIVMKYLEV